MVEDEAHLAQEQSNHIAGTKRFNHCHSTSVCAVIDGLVDSGSAPDLVLDFTDGGEASDRLKRVTKKLGLPTVTTSARDMADGIW